MRHSRSLAAAALVLACLGGCEPGFGQGDSGFGTMTTVYDRYDFASTDRGQATRGPRYLGHTVSEGGNPGSTREHVTLAVEMLMRSHPFSGLNYWHGSCAPGLEVEGVLLRSNVVLVQLLGTVPDHDRCTLTAREREVQRQQLAWTVRHLLDPFSEHEPPMVRVVEADGRSWDAVADWSFIDPAWRPSRSTPAPPH